MAGGRLIMDILPNTFRKVFFSEILNPYDITKFIWMEIENGCQYLISLIYIINSIQTSKCKLVSVDDIVI